MPELDDAVDDAIEEEKVETEVEEEEVEDRGDVVTEEEPEAKTEEPEPEAEADEVVEAEADDTEETEEAEAAEDEETPKAAIPKSRFDEVNNKRKEAEEKMREMEIRMAVLSDRQVRDEKKEEVKEEAFNFDDKEQAYMDAVLDGDTKLAQGIRSEIRQAERETYLAEAQNIAQKTGDQTRESLSFEETANTLIDTYAEFQKDTEQFDQSKLDEVIELKDAFILSGMGAAAALTKAANITMRGVSRIGDEPVEEPVAKKKTDVPKNIKTSKKQPPNAVVGESNGTTSDFPDISKMTDAELEALPASKLAEMRGDFL